MIHRWPEARAILEELLDLAPEVQTERLAALAEGDAELARVVEDFLAVDREEVLGSLSAGEHTQTSRRDVGRFRLRHRISTGRQGSVWVAARNDGAFDQEVAIKLIESEAVWSELGGSRADAVGHERRALALIESPYVVRLIDAGELDERTEWLALEYLDAEPITAYCHRRQLTVLARVALIEQAARGVEACHGAGVLHLDLSPGNVLVTAEGGVKIVDLGSSRRATGGGDPGLLAGPHVTPAGLTPAYAAPERFRPISQGSWVDERTDVWSLGALLHELLVGSVPIEVAHVPLGEARRRKLREDPLLFRRTLGTLGPTQLGGIARERGTSVHALARELRAGGLEAVTLAALRRDPRERTASAREFREDLERWRLGEPVRARRETLMQRAARLARREPRAAIAVLTVASSLAIGAGALYWGSLEARRAADRTARLVRFDAERIEAARRTSKTLVRELYQVISPLAGTRDQVGRLLDAGIEVARSAQDPQLSMWLGDALVKRALHGIETARWSPGLERECIAACDRALKLVAPLLIGRPTRLEPARVALEATQLKSLSYFNLCETGACRAAIHDVQAQLAALADMTEDPFAVMQIRTMQVRALTVDSLYGEAWGEFERVLENDRTSLAILKEFEVAPMHLDDGLRSQMLCTRVREHYLTFLSGDLAEDGDALLSEAIADADALLVLVARRPTVELLITRTAVTGSILATWLRRMDRDTEADVWLQRALDVARAPGLNRRMSALALVARLEAALGHESLSVHESEVQPVAAGGWMLMQARHALTRGETLEAARGASRAATLYDSSPRACAEHAVIQLARAEIDAVQGEVDLLESHKRAGSERRAYLERAEAWLARAVERFDAIGGDALHRKSIEPQALHVMARLKECRALLAE